MSEYHTGVWGSPSTAEEFALKTNRRYTGLSSADSEARFRRIFISHLKSDGYSEEDASRLIFKTPAPFHLPPSDADGLALLDAFRDHYRNQLPYSWYFEGLHRGTDSDASARKAPSRPVTFVVIPGIFGEFIDQLPFQSVLGVNRSLFAKKWVSALKQVQDQRYSLLNLGSVARPLDQLVKIGSIDQGDRTFCNVIVLRAGGGTLETLGSLESNVEVYRRRLEKVFNVIDEDADIYLVGYSRGLAVALALISALHADNKAGRLSSASRAWYGRLRGVVGLGGVFYGAKVAQDVLSGEAGATSRIVALLRDTVDRLQIVPDDATGREKGRIIGHNVASWSQFLMRVSAAEGAEVADGKSFLGHDLPKAYAGERRFRLGRLQRSSPNAAGIFSLVNGFFRKTFEFATLVSRYNDHVLGLKQLVGAVITGVETLTPRARDAWWRTHELPKDLLLFSVTGTMPDAYLNGFFSPLNSFAGFGAQSSDYDVLLRSSYYEVTASENTQINDSQVSHFASRYWEQMYSNHRYTHYYLGVLGTHHWGMAFPFMVKDEHRNRFPRPILLKSIAAFINEITASGLPAHGCGHQERV